MFLEQDVKQLQIERCDEKKESAVESGGSRILESFLECTKLRRYSSTKMIVDGWFHGELTPNGWMRIGMWRKEF